MNNECRTGEKQLDTSGRIRLVAAAAVPAALCRQVRLVEIGWRRLGGTLVVPTVVCREVRLVQDGRAARPLRIHNSSKQIGVRAGVGECEDEFASDRVEVEQYPVVLDVAVAKSFKVAGIRMFLRGLGIV